MDAPEPPFPAATIRSGMQPGLTLRFATEDPEGTAYQRWEVVEHAEDHVGIRFTPVDAGGEPLADGEVKTFGWEELESHAHFPPGTVRSRERLTVLGGEQKGWRYTVSDDESGTLTIFDFARAWPGPPVGVEVRVGDDVVQTMQLIDRQSPDPDQ